ncbi:hypothetical protein EVAR_60223_1 [Eumeta japonica]|uniref:Uncharacterized protein n=1 Tax=Eumeta variegata TaxID=151549 RepID=A0A4C1ZBG5_EUMVA|nr:hypothetical protein EVAR_60223_1 [Eumeta japonica]
MVFRQPSAAGAPENSPPRDTAGHGLVGARRRSGRGTEAATAATADDSSNGTDPRECFHCPMDDVNAAFASFTGAGPERKSLHNFAVIALNMKRHRRALERSTRGDFKFNYSFK